MRYLLDTSAIIELLRNPDGPLARRARGHPPGDIGLPAVAMHELYYGAFRSGRRDHNLGLVDGLVLEVVDLDREDARGAGEIRAELARRGVPIGPYDVLIAGQARTRGLTLVTANVAEFERVRELGVEDWGREE